MEVNFDLLTKYSEDSYAFLCTRQTINYENRNIDITIQRVWGLEVRPSFANHFCFVVYESDVYSIISILMEKESVSNFFRNIDIQEFLKNPNMYARNRNKSDFLFEKIVVYSNEMQNISEVLSNIDISFVPTDFLTQDGTNYNFKICLEQESLSLSFHSKASQKYNLLLKHCKRIAEIICDSSNQNFKDKFICQFF